MTLSRTNRQQLLFSALAAGRACFKCSIESTHSTTSNAVK
jgi:hypothetical protein